MVQDDFALIAPVKGLLPKKDVFTGDRSYNWNNSGTRLNSSHLTITH